VVSRRTEERGIGDFVLFRSLVLHCVESSGTRSFIIERVSRRFERHIVIIEDEGTACGQDVGNH